MSMTSESSDAYEPGSVWPQPDSMYSRGNTLYFVYNHLDKSPHFSVWLFITSTRGGKWHNVIRVNNLPDIPFWQFIYP